MFTNKTEQNSLIVFNKVLKEAYFQLFYESEDCFPRYLHLFPELESLIKAFEFDLSEFKFEKVAEFESFVETILLAVIQIFKSFNSFKKEVFAKMRN